MNRSDLFFLEAIFKMPVEQIPYQLLIVNQSKMATLDSEYQNIRVINDRHFGLSRSRNLGLSAVQARFVWILDDDVQVLPKAVETIVQNLNTHNDVHLFIFKIVTLTGMDKRTYPKKLNVLTKRKDLLQIHSIEMICDLHFLNSNNLKFDERFGLGAQFNMGEEYIFSKDILANKGKIVSIPQAIVVHDELSTGANPTTYDVVYAQGALAAYHIPWAVPFLRFKYAFSMWVRGYINDFKNIRYIYKVFGKGASDYLGSNKNDCSGS